MSSPSILEDTADFIAGRAVAAMTRYRQQLLPPLFSALMKYSDIHEYSGLHRATRAALVLPKRLPAASIMIITAKTCSAATWGLNVLRWVLCLITPGPLAKAKNMLHGSLAQTVLVRRGRDIRLQPHHHAGLYDR